MLSSRRLLEYWPDYTRQFLLELGSWGGTERVRGSVQTSRDGFNLVLRLHCMTEAMALMEQWLDEEERELNVAYHPVSLPGSNRYTETFAWARIDCDFATNEALIEELQSDWIRGLIWGGSRCRDTG
jgi:hypothetical protein